MRRLLIIISGLISIQACVTKKDFEARITSEKISHDEQFTALKKQMSAQNLEIAILKDSIRNQEQWKKEMQRNLIAVYEKAAYVQDIPTARTSLQMLLTLSPDMNTWAYDSLAFYHYFHSNPQDLARSTFSVNYYLREGLKLDSSNLFLQELKARVLLIEQNDTGSYSLFNKLYNKTGDYTYLWYMAYIEAARGNIKTLEKSVNKVLSSDILPTKKVRLDHLPEHLRESVPVKPAFLYLKSVIYQSKGQYQQMANTLKESLKLYPDFYLSNKTLAELRQASQGTIR